MIVIAPDPTSIIIHLADTGCNLLILSSLICIERCLSCIAALMKLACSTEALGEVLLLCSNMLMLNAFCQLTPWWVCGTSQRTWRDWLITAAPLPAQPQPVFTSSSRLVSSFQQFMSLLFCVTLWSHISSIQLLCCDFKFKPHAAFTLRAVIVRISCCCALGETESHFPESCWSYQGHTAPVFKRAELPLCETQVCLQKAKSGPRLRLTLSLNVNLISSSVKGVLIGSAFVSVSVCLQSLSRMSLCCGPIWKSPSYPWTWANCRAVKEIYWMRKSSISMRKHAVG